VTPGEVNRGSGYVVHYIVPFKTLRRNGQICRRLLAIDVLLDDTLYSIKRNPRSSLVSENSVNSSHEGAYVCAMREMPVTSIYPLPMYSLIISPRRGAHPLPITDRIGKQ